MQVGAHVEIVGLGMKYEQSFPLLRALGADGVEVVFKDQTPLSLASTDKDFSRAQALARDEGLAICSMTNAYGWFLPLTSSDPAIRKKGVTALKRALEGAALLGTDSLLMIPGYAQTSFISNAETCAPATAVQRAWEGIAQAAEDAVQLNVSINVEAVWNGMLRTANEMSAFLDAFHSDGVGFYMDTGNVYPEGEPVEWIRRLGSHIKRVHVKDYLPSACGMEVFCPLGEGRVRFAEVYKALAAVGYDGWLSAEHHSRREAQSAKHSLDFIRSMISRQQKSSCQTS